MNPSQFLLTCIYRISKRRKVWRDKNLSLQTVKMAHLYFFLNDIVSAARGNPGKLSLVNVDFPEGGEL